MAVELAHEKAAWRDLAPPAPDGTGAGGAVGAGAAGAAGHTGRAVRHAPPVRALALSSGALTATFRHVGPLCLLSLTGALTAGTLGILESQIDRLGRTACRRVVIDASGLTMIDDAGARVLTGLHHYVEARGGRLQVTGAAGGVAQVLASTPLLAECGAAG